MPLANTALYFLTQNAILLVENAIISLLHITSSAGFDTNPLGLERISVILGILGVSRLISTCLTSQLHQIIPSYFLLGEIINSSIRHKLSYTSVFSPLMLKYPMNNYAVLSIRYRMQIRAVKIKHYSLCKVKWIPFRRF